MIGSATADSGLRPQGAIICKDFSPVDDYVLLDIEGRERVTPGGIALPQNYEGEMHVCTAKVLAVGPNTVQPAEGERVMVNPSAVRMFSLYDSVSQDPDRRVCLVRSNQVMAILTS